MRGVFFLGIDVNVVKFHELSIIEIGREEVLSEINKLTHC